MNQFSKDNIEVFAHQSSKEGKAFCGDSYFYMATDDYFVCILADGLGSGKYAFEASSAAVAIVENHHHEDVDTLMRLCNQSMLAKRGAAVSILKVYFQSREFVYSCVGNIRFFLYSPQGKLTYPLPVTGYLSGRPQTYHTQRFSYVPHSKFLIFSDGYELQGIKTLLNGVLPIETIANEIRTNHTKANDDSTFIIGSLL